MRKRLFQFHSWLGFIGALALVLLSLTGSTLVFHKELDRALNPSLLIVKTQPTPYHWTLSCWQLVPHGRNDIVSLSHLSTIKQGGRMHGPCPVAVAGLAIMATNIINNSPQGRHSAVPEIVESCLPETLWRN